MIFVDDIPFPDSAPASTNAVDDGDGLLLSLLEHPLLAFASERLKSTAEIDVSDFISRSGGRHVYVFQREYATVDPSLVQYVGTDEATTCVCIAIRNRLNGMTSVAHLDHPRVVNSGLVQMLSLLVDCDKDAPLDVHLVGGFDDASDEYTDGSSKRLKKSLGYSFPLCSTIITALSSRREKFHVGTLCVLGHNTKKDSSGRAFPVLTGLLVETSSGTILPARFNKNSRVPDEIVRRIRVTVSFDDYCWRWKLLETYDTKLDRFKIACCSWNSGWCSWASSLQQCSDSEILFRCSTSPLAENLDFIDNERRMLDYLIRHPCWLHTFPARKSRVFQRSSDSGWSRCAT